MASNRSKYSGTFSFLRRRSDEGKSKPKATKTSKNKTSYSKESISTVSTSTVRVTIKQSSSTAGGEPPSAGTYAFKAGRQAIEILQKFANALPVPCANEVLEIALLLMNTYEDVTKIEEQVKDVHNRIGCLKLVMIDGLSGKDAALPSPQVIRDIEKNRPSSDPGRPGEDHLPKSLAPRLFKDANRETVVACLDRLSDALQSFQVTRTIRDRNTLFEIQIRLESMNKVTGKMAEQVNEV
ncbi:hypothetical protein FRC19_000707 [Serendipita sp. 401]|nr:hypothetical protein FRC19_000707 [Serendipita sp. 401]KAG9049069.1 hypothetical protein FS842_000250 [Serendipita sp. 407]